MRVGGFASGEWKVQSVIMTQPGFVPLSQYREYPVEEMERRAADFYADLASLTHTPSPMNFLNKILGRPPNERPFLLLVVGYPARDARVPVIGKKPLGQHANRAPSVSTRSRRIRLGRT